MYCEKLMQTARWYFYSKKMDSLQIEDVFANEWKTRIIDKIIDKIIETFPSTKLSFSSLVEFEFYCNKHVKYENLCDYFIIIFAEGTGSCNISYSKITFAIIFEQDVLKCYLYRKLKHMDAVYCPILDLNKNFIGYCYDYFCNKSDKFPEENPNLVNVKHVFVLWHVKWLQLMMIYEYYKNPDDFVWNNVERVFADEYMLKIILRY